MSDSLAVALFVTLSLGLRLVPGQLRRNSDLTSEISFAFFGSRQPFSAAMAGLWYANWVRT